MASRFARYVRRIVRTALILAVLALVLASVQALFHPFDAYIEKGTAFVAGLDSRLSREAFNGITIGSLALILGLCVFPLFLRRIDEKAYARGLWRGLVSAAVFYLSNQLFALASRIGRVHFIVAIVAVVVVTALVVEGVSLAVKEEEEKSFRTDVVASIASGLLFGVLVKLAGYGLELLRRKAGV
jgi:hypothetical protein